VPADTSPALIKAARRVGICFIGVLVGLALRLAWLYPLLPATDLGWFAVAGSGLVVMAWACICIVFILWLLRQQSLVLFFKSVGAVVALSLGVGAFAAAYGARAFFTAKLSYFGRL
jgi:hypothetical protein